MRKPRALGDELKRKLNCTVYIEDMPGKNAVALECCPATPFHFRVWTAPTRRGERENVTATRSRALAASQLMAGENSIPMLKAWQGSFMTCFTEVDQELGQFLEQRPGYKAAYAPWMCRDDLQVWDHKEVLRGEVSGALLLTRRNVAVCAESVRNNTLRVFVFSCSRSSCLHARSFTKNSTPGALAWYCESVAPTGSDLSRSPLLPALCVCHTDHIVAGPRILEVLPHFGWHNFSVAERPLLDQDKVDT